MKFSETIFLIQSYKKQNVQISSGIAKSKTYITETYFHFKTYFIHRVIKI